MAAVPRVRDHGRGPAQRGEAVADRPRRRAGRAVLLLGRRDAARPHRVDVDREPAAADDVAVGRGRVLRAEPALDPVRAAGEERGVTGLSVT